MFRRVTKSDSARRALGFDIGAHTIKALLLEETADALTVCYAARVPTPADALQKGILVGQREVAAQLRRIAEHPDVRMDAASLSIPMEQALVRSIDLPLMDPESLRAATRFEARKYLPYSVDDAEVDILPIDQPGGEKEGRARALLAAAPRGVVQSRAETLEMAGLVVASVEVESVALLRSLNTPLDRQRMPGRSPALVYVQLGEESSWMSVLQDTDIRFVRAIAWGSNHLTSALSQGIGCTLDEAQRIKESAGAAIDETGRFSWEEGDARRETDRLIPELDLLCRELQRLLNYYRSLYPERSYEAILHQMILCGGTAGLHGLDRYFSQKLQIEVKVRNPLRAVTSWRSPGNLASSEQYQACFGVAFGLALGELHAGAQRGEARSQAREFVWRRKAA